MAEDGLVAFAGDPCGWDEALARFGLVGGVQADEHSRIDGTQTVTNASNGSSATRR